MIRKARYAGSFYVANKDKLIKSIENCFLSFLGPEKLPSEVDKEKGIKPFLLVPHAGYVFSGPVAAWSYLELSKYESPKTVIIFGPNHTGMGSEIAVPNNAKAWETPMGQIEINHNLIDKLIEENSRIRPNDLSHDREHSIEVQLPFLQYIFGNDFKFIPISLLDQGMDSSMLLGETISKVCNDENVVVIASSDFTHFENHESASDKDSQVLEAINNMDVKQMYDVKYSLNVSMCGYGPIAATIESAKRMGRTECSILKYATSGESSGDKRQVVGYGAATFFPKKNS